MRSIGLMTFLLLALSLAGGDDRLCVQTHYGHENWEPLSTIEQIRDLGVGWIRDDLYWHSVEKEKGKYAIPEYAWKWLKAAKANHLKVILILNGDNRKCYQDPFDQEGYVNFVRFVANEVRDYADALELVNEPFNHFRNMVPGKTAENSHWNGWDPATGATDAWVEKYRLLMNAAAEAIHETAPGRYRVIGLGCSLPVNLRLLRLGVSARIDGMALHPYSYRYVPELQPYGDTPGFRKRDGVVLGDRAGTLASIIRDLQAASRENKGPGELWITELGYTTFRPVASGRYGGFTEEAQAKYALRHFLECLGLGVRLTSWYAFYCRQNSPFSNLGNFGLVNFDGTPRPAYHAIRRLTAVIEGYEAAPWGDVRIHFRKLRHFTNRPDPHPLTWDGSLRESWGTSRAYTFQSTDGKTRLAAVWSSERAGGDLQPRLADLAITTDRIATSVAALDLFSGERRPVKFRQKGRLLRIDGFTVPDHPVLLTLEGTEPAAEETIVTEPVFTGDWEVRTGKGDEASWEVRGEAGILNVRNAARFAGAGRSFIIPAERPCVALRVRSSIEAAMLLRITDQTGRTFQYKYPLPPSNQWEDIQVNLLRDRRQSWGAEEGGGTPRLPARNLFLGVEQPDRTGTVEFKELQLLPE